MAFVLNILVGTVVIYGGVLLCKCRCVSCRFLIFVTCDPQLSDTNAQVAINNALYLGAPQVFNTTKDDCIWKRGAEKDECPDPNISIILYTSDDYIYKTLVSLYYRAIYKQIITQLKGIRYMRKILSHVSLRMIPMYGLCQMQDFQCKSVSFLSYFTWLMNLSDILNA